MGFSHTWTHIYSINPHGIHMLVNSWRVIHNVETRIHIQTHLYIIILQSTSVTFGTEILFFSLFSVWWQSSRLRASSCTCNLKCMLACIQVSQLLYHHRCEYCVPYFPGKIGWTQMTTFFIQIIKGFCICYSVATIEIVNNPVPSLDHFMSTLRKKTMEKCFFAFFPPISVRQIL